MIFRSFLRQYYENAIFSKYMLAIAYYILSIDNCTDLGRLMCNSNYVKRWGLGKFNNFSINQNYREIDFRDSRSAKSTTLTHLEVLNFDVLNFCTLGRLKTTKTTQFRAPKIAKMAILELLDSPKRISHKI